MSKVHCNDDQNALSVDPPFRLQQSEQYETPDDFSSNQEALLDHLIVVEAKRNTIEKKTSEQAASQEW